MITIESLEANTGLLELRIVDQVDNEDSYILDIVDDGISQYLFIADKNDNTLQFQCFSEGNGDLHLERKTKWHLNRKITLEEIEREIYDYLRMV